MPLRSFFSSFALVTTLVVSALGCGGGGGTCVAGTTQVCACTATSMGIQTCGASGAFGACVCGPGTDGGAMDGSATDSGGGDAAHGDSGIVDLGSDTGPVDASCSTAADGDGDGHTSIACGGDDCNDADPHSYPGNVEVCDATGHDEDCNPATLGADGDGDTFVSTACCNAQPSGPVLCGTDCDDMRATVNPSAAESCNAIDDNCNGMVDEGVTMTCYADGDGDGYAAAGAASHDACVCGAGSTAMMPGAGTTDCNDGNASINPAASEVCNHVDDNCNGTADEGVSVTVYPDADADGYGSTTGMPGCAGTPGTSTNNTDCDDAHASAHPGATEICDGIDNDCNGMTDENLGGPCTAGVGACAVPGRYACSGACSGPVGTPSSTLHFMAAPNGSWDWNCDGTIEVNTGLAAISATSPCSSRIGSACYAGESLLAPLVLPRDCATVHAEYSCSIVGGACVDNTYDSNITVGCY